MSKEITYRFYVPNDEEHIVRLLDDSFRGWPKFPVDKIDYWTWKYLDNPNWVNNISIALDQGEIIGCKHSVFLRLKLENKLTKCGLGSGLAVKREYRRKGISNELTRRSLTKRKEYGVNLSYFVTSNPLLIKKYRREKGPVLPFRVAVYVHIQDIDKQIKQMKTKRPFIREGYLASSFYNWIKRKVNHVEIKFKGEIKNYENFDSRIDVLWENISGEYDLVNKRDAVFLNWRYADSRNGYHHVLVAEEEGKVLGFCVGYVNHYLEGYPLGYIMDLFTSPSRKDVMMALIKKMLGYFFQNNCNAITALAPEGSNLAEALSLSGFLNSREKLNLYFGRSTLLIEDYDIRQILGKCTPNRIHFCYGDIDSLPVNPPNQTSDS